MNKPQDFFAAVRVGDLDAIRVLLQQQPGLANATIPGDSSLLSGEIWQDLKIVPLPAGDPRAGMALHYAALWGKCDLAQLLPDHGADVNASAYENNHEMTAPVVLAAWEGGLEVLRILLEHGANPNASSSNGVTPLSTARAHGKQDRIDLLVQYGASE